MIEMQVKIQEMEKNLSLQIEKSLNLKMKEMGKSFGINTDTEKLCEKAVQTEKKTIYAQRKFFLRPTKPDSTQPRQFLIPSPKLSNLSPKPLRKSIVLVQKRGNISRGKAKTAANVARDNKMPRK